MRCSRSKCVPLAAPAEVGANFTPNVTLCPAVNVCGVVRPVVLKAAPVTVAELTFTLAVPLFVNVTFTVSCFPSTGCQSSPTKDSPSGCPALPCPSEES